MVLFRWPLKNVSLPLEHQHVLSEHVRSQSGCVITTQTFEANTAM